MPFADASFLVALLDEEDQWHARARAAAPALMKLRPWRTHALALGEVVAIVGSRRGGKPARSAYEMIRDTMEVRTPTLADLDDAMVHVLRHDGDLSLSDALFLAYAARDDEGAILTFDAGFDRTGLTRLPKG